MVLIVDDKPNQKQQVVLTKRNRSLKHHPGQISLPGGQQDLGESLRNTALRETDEEIGVASESVEVIGQLSHVYIPPSDYTITPFVGWCDATTPVQLKKNSDEVEEILLADLDILLSPDTLQFGTIRSESEAMESSFFDVEGHQVWGATAIVLNDLVELIRHYVR